MSWSFKRRSIRAFGEEGERKNLAALDHPASVGRIDRLNDWDSIVRSYLSANVDTFIAHPGRHAKLQEALPPGASLVAHMSVGSTHLGSQGAKVIAYQLEDIRRLDIDAVSVHVNIGDDYSLSSLKECARIIQQAEAFELPTLVMAYDSRNSKQGSAEGDPDPVRYCVELATDIGAAAVKVDVTGLKGPGLQEVTHNAMIPVFLSGSERTPEEIRELLDASPKFRGVVVGRTVFQAPDAYGAAHIINQPAEG